MLLPVPRLLIYRAR